MSIKAGCFETICEPWPKPDACKTYCDTPEAEQLFDTWWDAVTEWAYEETCYQFPGICPAETEPCPPCGCTCVYTCWCGPWGIIPLQEAFCWPIAIDGNNRPLLELAFPQEDGTFTTFTPIDENPVFKLRPDCTTLEFCQPIQGSKGCAASWPETNCESPWTIRAMVGAQPPSMLLLALAEFVGNIVKECQGQDSCLPQGVKSITRRGITMDVGDQFSETINFDDKSTGVPKLDIALRRWGSCPPSHISHDPLRKLFESRRQIWAFNGVLDPAGLSWL